MDLVSDIEQGLGKERLQKLKQNEDSYQIFWLGVLEHRSNIDPKRDPIPYLISCGYGAIANSRLTSNTRNKMRVCDRCGKIFSYRHSVCPCCQEESRTEQKIFSTTLSDGTDLEFEYEDNQEWILKSDVERFVQTLHGNERYVAKRWLIDRADLRYDNHCKQIALELGCSSPYVARVKKAIRNKWKLIADR